jgi:hypothetical protein
MTNYVQSSMFDAQDLPLFSGTAPACTLPAFEPEPVHVQESLAKCRFCADTGKLGDHALCWCEAGQAAKEAATQLVRSGECGLALLYKVQEVHNV